MVRQGNSGQRTSDVGHFSINSGCRNPQKDDSKILTSPANHLKKFFDMLKIRRLEQVVDPRVEIRFIRPTTF